jgi:ABC-2 type transport system ATP-binding protein
LIKATDLTKKYGGLTAVDHLNLTVNPGEIFGFLGPNGAGKTTTIKMLVGLLAPTSGTAEICGVNVANDPVAAKAHLGFVPDTPDIYEKLSARELLEFVADLLALSTTSCRILEI